jgi:galactose mutarotase-like enzyme
LEEQRIGMMYLNLVKGWFGGLWDRLFPRGVRRSRWVPLLAIAVIVALPIVAWRLHRLGRFGYLKREIQGVPQAGPPVGPRPGGVDPIVLTRSQTVGSNLPEFRSVTLLPGLGMEILQITASVPDKGDVELLAGPTLKDLAEGTTPMRVGPNDRWGALELPWAGLVTGVLTPVGTALRTSWHGKTIEAPTDTGVRGIAEGGMLAGLNADTFQSSPETNPTVASATFKGVDFDGHWTSKTDVTVKATLSATTLELTVTATNVGDQPEPMGIGWHPRFLIVSGHRDAVEVRLPNGEQLEIADHVKGIPSGRFAAPSPLLNRFQNRAGVLGVESIDESVVDPKAGLLDSGVVAEIRDPDSDFGLRMKAESEGMREVRLSSPASANYVSVGMQTNLDDPFGKEWSAATPAIATLAPGQSAQWKVQLEIFPVAHHGAAGR